VHSFWLSSQNSETFSKDLHRHLYEYTGSIEIKAGTDAIARDLANQAVTTRAGILGVPLRLTALIKFDMGRTGPLTVYVEI